MCAEFRRSGKIRQCNPRFAGGSTKSEYVMIGALVAIIGGALFITFLSLSSGGDRPRQVHVENRFECVKCGHQFVPDPQSAAAGMTEDEMSILDCPKCRAKASCYAMTYCPKCGEYYLPDAMKAHAAGQKAPTQPAGGAQPATIRCPKCGTDLVEYMRHQQEKGGW